MRTVYWFLLFVIWLPFSANAINVALPNGIVKFTLKSPDSLGTTAAQQSLAIGGFSGLRFLKSTTDGKLLFLTHTDRGPNTESFKKNGVVIRPFMLPKFTPRLVVLEANLTTKTMTIVRQIKLKDFAGKLLTGLPRQKSQENPVNLYGQPLAFDKLGMDLEGIDIAGDGGYWMVDEYGPSIIHFSSQGKLVDWFQPGKGLPELIKKRKLNRGFEGIALHGQTAFAILQSPISNEKVLPIIEFDIKKRQTTKVYFYKPDEQSARIGDMVALDTYHFLVIEQTKKNKKIFLINLLNTNKNKIVSKQLIVNLHNLGVKEDKIEGITLVGLNHIAIITDNDFALTGTLIQKTGKATFKKEYSTLYLIPLPAVLKNKLN
ncbi:esterase-like activity of phytase family protein [Legionella hackeliae]|uniref:Phytase-like domain-containing protein n=1 Tax=Legionella hackeliae TaxID=449 RepID=A0A0A8UNZ0_LEGHA|nr:esterase-like activity of phytase family protein [Legionella hackeliae]KTD13864.1 hypothetical protein Lhac_0708 [Legionella hackeliae]CEK10565.1 exported protein of unknown function [Legionella hackeliae]STX47305.1 Uncharacterized protein conserved in bacteria [Legionella hackeliae]